jgi:putative multicomponent Na+:H+ antiporter subunit B
MIDPYLYIMIALLPVAASMVVTQVNPYHALVIRGILGAIAAMLYAVLGAADVALTEALVGTMLAITLYAVAVRSSLVLRLGVLEDEAVTNSATEASEVAKDAPKESQSDQQFGQVITDLRTVLNKRHMRLELVPYANSQALQRALLDREVHATCAHGSQLIADLDSMNAGTEPLPYRIITRIRRIYDMMQTELSSPATSLSYVSVADSGEVKS